MNLRYLPFFIENSKTFPEMDIAVQVTSFLFCISSLFQLVQPYSMQKNLVLLRNRGASRENGFMDPLLTKA